MYVQAHLCVPDTPGTVDASGHDGLDEGTNVLVFHCTFLVCESRSVTAKGHRLVLSRGKLVLFFLNNQVRDTGQTFPNPTWPLIFFQKMTNE